MSYDDETFEKLPEELREALRSEKTKDVRPSNYKERINSLNKLGVEELLVCEPNAAVHDLAISRNILVNATKGAKHTTNAAKLKSILDDLGMWEGDKKLHLVYAVQVGEFDGFRHSYKYNGDFELPVRENQGDTDSYEKKEKEVLELRQKLWSKVALYVMDVDYLAVNFEV